MEEKKKPKKLSGAAKLSHEKKLKLQQHLNRCVNLTKWAKNHLPDECRYSGSLKRAMLEVHMEVVDTWDPVTTLFCKCMKFTHYSSPVTMMVPIIIVDDVIYIDDATNHNYESHMVNDWQSCFERWISLARNTCALKSDQPQYNRNTFKP